MLEQKQSKADELIALLKQTPALACELCQVWVASDYAANLCIQNPAMLLDLINSSELERSVKNDFQAQLDVLLQTFYSNDNDASELQEATKQAIKKTLRVYHQQQMLRIIWRDVCAKAPVMEVCADMSHLADAALHSTLNLLHHWAVLQWGEPRGAESNDLQSLVVIGMGKLGAHELNLSSDIDLIFSYPEGGQTQRPADNKRPALTNQQYFTRLGQSLIDMLDTVTADGFVFRVDMRLRPYGSEGALVCSFDAMEDYYQSQGRDWERYAMIKARIVAGNKTAGEVLLGRLRPFVYRRYIDFSAIEALRGMKIQINKQVRRKGMSQDVKLGPGGIREVEFVVQALQLVHGGRERSLQQVSLHRAMEALVQNNYLPAETVAELQSAYLFLRKLEHRLQGLANKQTQSLVTNPLEQQRIALAMGFPTWTELLAQLNEHRSRVMAHFKQVIHTEEEDDSQQPGADDSDWKALWKEELGKEALSKEDLSKEALSKEDQGKEAAVKFLAQHNLEAPAQSLRLLTEFRKSRNFVMLPTDSRMRFNRFMPVLLSAVAEAEKPSLSLSRVMVLIEAVSRRTAYLVLLLENPGTLQQLILLCSGSPFITEFLSKHPVLLDELLGGISQPPEKSALQAELQQQLLRIEPDNFEEQMEYLRYFKLSHTLQVAAAQITGRMTVMKVSDYLSFTAEAVLEQVLALSWDFLVKKFGYPVNSDGSWGEPDFAIIAYGKLGGIELSYISDLDLVFLHRGVLDQETVIGSTPASASSNKTSQATQSPQAQRAINSREFYTRLAQRIIMMLGTYTISGKLYEVDMRLRPSGKSGLLVSSLDAFRHYQEVEAWTWEHQALVRARGVAGSRALHAEFDKVRAAVLSKERDAAKLREEVAQMRQRMREELTRKAGSDKHKPPFVIKQGAGGIVDIEFIVQYLVLAESRRCTPLLTWSDNVRILEAAQGCELLEPQESEFLTEAYLALRSTLHHFALQEQDLADPLASLAGYQQGVSRIWNRIFGDTLESADAAQQADQ